MKTGIYQIRNIHNNKLYIGSSVDLKRRKNDHFSSLKRGSHHSLKLQSAYSKHGESSFVFEILEECTKQQLIELEQIYLDKLKPHYNIRQTASFHITGWQPSQSMKEKMSKNRKGKSFHTPKQINAIKKAHTGKLVLIHTRMKRARAVIQIDLVTGEQIAEYYSVQEAFRQTGINNIGGVLRGYQSKAGGYMWRYRDESMQDIQNLEQKKIIKQHNVELGRAQAAIKRRKSVAQIDTKSGKTIKIWDSLKEADEFFGGKSNVTNVINGKQKTAYGFCWKLVN